MTVVKVNNFIYLFIAFFFVFCFIFYFEKFLDLLRVIIWPGILLLGAFYFRKVFTYMFLSFEEFNFFGIKGKLRDVEEVIEERVKLKVAEIKLHEKMQALQVNERTNEEWELEFKELYTDNIKLEDELKEARAKLDAFGRLLTELESLGSIKLADADVVFGITTPMATNLAPGLNHVLWQTIFTVANRPVFLKKIKFRIKGQIGPNDLENINLYIDGVSIQPYYIGKDNSEIEIDLTREPIILSTGSRVISLRSNINHNAKGKEFTIAVLPLEDLELLDSSFLNKINFSITSNPLQSTISVI